MLGLTYLNWVKTAASGSRGVLVQRYGPPAALTACLFGLAWLGWSNIQGRPPTLPSAEINLPAQKTAEELPAQTADLEPMRAAQSLNTEEVSAPETVKPGLEAAKNEAGPSSRGRGQDRSLAAQTRGEACQWRQKARSHWIEDRGAARCRSSRRSLSIRNADRAKTGTKRSRRRFRSVAASQRAGRSPPAGNHSIDGARKQVERRIRIWATGQLIASSAELMSPTVRAIYQTQSLEGGRA